MKPNLFIVGQPKSGTTALATFLDQHPEIFISKPKEPGFFCRDLIAESDRFHGKVTKLHFPIRQLQEYLRLFEQAETLIQGEASTHYLFSRSAAAEIAAFNPAAKIIMAFRDPVGFLPSWHMQQVNEAAEPIEDFQAALAAEADRKKGKELNSRIRTPSHLYYSERVKYAEQVARYLQWFPKKQIQIMLFQDFQRSNEKVYLETLGFLGVARNFCPRFEEVHGSKAARSKLLNLLARNPVLKGVFRAMIPPRTYDRMQRGIQSLLLKPQRRSALSPDLRATLRDRFRNEVEALDDLLHREEYLSTERSLLKEWGYNTTS